MAGTTAFYGITYPTSTDYVKDGATAIQTVATGFDSAVAIPTYNAQTGNTYTFVLSDTGKTVTANNAGSQTYTIPPTASVAWTANTTLTVLNLGAGVVTFAAGAGVTVTNTAATLAQYATAQLIRTGLNAWTVAPFGSSSAGGAWTAYTPTLTGFTAGIGGTVIARYSQVGKVVNGFVKVTLGTGFTMTDISISLPVAKQATTTYVQQSWTLSDTGAGDFPAIPRNESGNIVAVFIMNANTTYVAPAFVSATIPFTWAATDVVNVAFSYECA